MFVGKATDSWQSPVLKRNRRTGLMEGPMASSTPINPERESQTDRQTDIWTGIRRRRGICNSDQRRSRDIFRRPTQTSHKRTQPTRSNRRPDRTGPSRKSTWTPRTRGTHLSRRRLNKQYIMSTTCRRYGLTRTRERCDYAAIILFCIVSISLFDQPVRMTNRKLFHDVI